MERAGVLINKLQEQLTQNANVNSMLVTAQLLHSELLFCAKKATNGTQKIAVVVPNVVAVAAVTAEVLENNYKPLPTPGNDPEPMPAPEAPLPETTPSPTPRPEPEPIPHFVEQKPWMDVFPKKEDQLPHWSLDPVLEVPTLAHQEKVVYELNDTMVEENNASVNDKLKHNNAEGRVVLTRLTYSRPEKSH